jgi:hypothetical protein
MLSQLLVQFVFRITFGLTLAMAMTPAARVTSGFFRVHLWVLMGINTLASLALYSQLEQFRQALSQPTLALTLAIGLAVTSYVAAVIWLYERHDLGRLLLVVLTVASLIAAILATPLQPSATATGIVLVIADLASSGLLLGATLAAMFLGHWYLNTPTMQLLPLKRLVVLMAIAILIRTVVSGSGLALHVYSGQPLETQFWIFVAFRWLSGILATLIFAMLAWYTLKVPNTQSATGILYAGVVVAFLGELTSQLLSVDNLYPL